MLLRDFIATFSGTYVRENNPVIKLFVDNILLNDYPLSYLQNIPKESVLNLHMDMEIVNMYILHSNAISVQIRTSMKKSIPILQVSTYPCVKDVSSNDGYKPIWCGFAHPITGEILETHTEDEAKAGDYHVESYFSNEELINKFNNGEIAFFYVHNGIIAFDYAHPDFEGDINEAFLSNMIAKSFPLWKVTHKLGKKTWIDVERR